MSDSVSVSVSATRERVSVSIDAAREVVQVKVISDAYTLPTASASVLGGVKIGTGLTITAGVLSTSGSGYTLPIATGSVLGGIKSSGDIIVDAGTGVATVNGSESGGAGTLVRRDSQGSAELNDLLAQRIIRPNNGVDASELRLDFAGGIMIGAPHTVTVKNATGTLAFLSDIPAAPSSIVGITGTLAEFNTALTDGNFATAQDLSEYLPLTGGSVTGAIDMGSYSLRAGELLHGATGSLAVDLDNRQLIADDGSTVALDWSTGTVAKLSDITGTNSGTNTGDQDLSGYQLKAGTLALAGFSGITGTIAISNVSGLQAALDAKQSAITFGTGVQTALGSALGTPGGVARAIEIKTSNFTAVVGGRYILESAGTITVTSPTGTTQGDSFECWIGSGSAVINGTTYAASRFSIRARYTGAAWANPSPVISDAASFTSTTRPTSAGTGTPSSTDLITRADGDARYPFPETKASSAQMDATTGTLADVTGLTGWTLEANRTYRVELFFEITTTANASWKLVFMSSQNLGFQGTAQTGPGFYVINVANPLSWYINSLTNIDIGNRVLNNGKVSGYSSGIIKTGGSAPTVKIQFAQGGTVAGTVSLLTGAVCVITKLN